MSPAINPDSKTTSQDLSTAPTKSLPFFSEYEIETRGGREVGPSGLAPPAFDEPPDFTPYEASMRVRGDHHTVSHDPHLNEDGEALYRFLLGQAANPPVFHIGCKGTHKETREYGDSASTEDTVTDFCFYLQPRLLRETPPIFIVGDRSVAFRGRVAKEVDASSAGGANIEAMAEGLEQRQSRRRASRREQKAAEAANAHRKEQGLPPWVALLGETPGTQASIESEEDRNRFQHSTYGPPGVWLSDPIPPLLAPSRSLRQWADDYCASNKVIKEFNFDKVVYGWNLELLRGKIYDTVKANWDPKHGGLHHKVEVWFETSHDVVSVRPDDWLSRMLSHQWIKAVLCILLIYPLLIWPAKQFYGGEWRIAGSAYALAKWIHLEDSIPGESVDAYRSRIGPYSTAPLKSTPRGVSRLMGSTEEAWFEKWEATIARYAKQELNDTTGVDAPGPLW
ncbi:hypothetical protein FRB97_001739 [Tulasnella sp. 331]|nr:hypothetical protein FRB97_001739 [Tulasnella sp. 331]